MIGALLGLAIAVQATPCAAQVLKMHPGVVASGGPGTPFLLGGGTEVGISPGTSPRSTTTATCPAGSAIMAAVLNAGDNSAALTGFSDGTNTYSTPTPIQPYTGGTSAQTLALYATGPIGSSLSSGASMGPNLTASTRIYQVLVCFPGVTTLDPETAGSASDLSGTSNPSVNIPANATAPQIAAFIVNSSFFGDASNLTAAYTDVGGATGINGTFGIRFWVPSLSTTSGSPTTLSATYVSGVGPAWAAFQRTVK